VPDAEQGPARWTLKLIQTHCGELSDLKTLSGVFRRLKRWKIAWKRSRLHLSSPDVEYDIKMERIGHARWEAEADPDAVRLVYADQASFYRMPHPGYTWSPKQGGGRGQPKAAHTPGANTKRRIMATLDIYDGRVVFHTAKQIGAKALARFLKKLRTAYGPDVRVVLVWDNWPVHYHPLVLEAAREHRIELLYLPTYAPWTNPIEKLWKKLREELLHLHRHSDKWMELRRRVDEYLAKLDRANPELLRYVGLAPKPLPN
jgi:putative transposase